MKAMKDKRKFGGASPVSKNRNCKKFGYSYDKEVRRIWRIEGSTPFCATPLNLLLILKYN